MNWHSKEIRELISLALREDRAREDVTTQALIHPAWRVRAEIKAKQPGVVAGLPLAGMIFKSLDPRCRFQPKCPDGKIVKKGACLAVVQGPARIILSGERPALNALQHLSGIATFTHEQVRRLGPVQTRLYDTRKTLPGWRILQKYAVRCGGAFNHRMSLANAILIKDNHMKVCRLAKSDWKKNFYHFKKKHPDLPNQFEIQTETDLKDAFEIKPQMVLLDNMPFSHLRRVVRALRKNLPLTKIEISGGIRPDQLRRLAGLGVERISMGKLTHSAPAFDCSLDITHVIAR